MQSSFLRNTRSVRFCSYKMFQQSHNWNYTTLLVFFSHSLFVVDSLSCCPDPPFRTKAFIPPAAETVSCYQFTSRSFSNNFSGLKRTASLQPARKTMCKSGKGEVQLTAFSSPSGTFLKGPSSSSLRAPQGIR